MYREATENEIQYRHQFTTSFITNIFDPIENKEYLIRKTNMKDASKTHNWEFINRLVQINKYANKITKTLIKKRIRSGYNDIHLTRNNPFTDNNRVKTIVINRIKEVYPNSLIKVEFNHENDIKVHIELDIKDWYNEST